MPVKPANTEANTEAAEAATNPPPTKAWYSEGADEIEKELKRQTEVKVPRRWYLPVEKSNQLTFITDNPFSFREHNLKLDGNWRNWFTCIGKGCPLCKAGNDAYLASAWLVIDHSVWSDQAGNEHKDEPRLLVTKARVASRILKIRAKQDGLTGVRCEVFRAEAMSPNTGDQFDVEKKHTPNELAKIAWWPKKADLLKPNFPEWFAPKDAMDLKEIVGKISDAPDPEEKEEKPVRF